MVCVILERNSRRMNVVQTLRHRAELQPSVAAIVDRTIRGDRVISFSVLNRMVDYQAIRLAQQGIAPGDEVLLLLNPCQEFYLFLLALLQIGAVPVLGNRLDRGRTLQPWIGARPPKACLLARTRYRFRSLGQELGSIKERLFTRAFRFEQRWLRLGHLGTIKDLPANAPALLELVSNRESISGGWLWTQTQLDRNIQRLLTHLKMKAGEIDLCLRPLQLLANVSAGITSVIPPRVALLGERRRLHQIDKFKPVRAAAPAAVLSRYLRHASSPLHKIFITDAPLDPEVVDFFSGRLQHANIDLFFGPDVPLAMCSLNNYQNTGNNRWVGTFFDDIRWRLQASKPVTMSGSSPLADSEAGELLICAEFLPQALNPEGKPDTARYVQGVDGTAWLRTGYSGRLANKERFCLDG
jgi:AMP-binding enzyme